MRGGSGSMCQCCVSDSERDEKQESLQEVFDKYRDVSGAIIPVLQEAQDIYGYLPKEVLEQISEELKIPLSKVYGITTFYAQFHLTPRGRNIVRVCLGTACHVRGGAQVLEKLQEELQIDDGETTEDLSFTLESVACIGACGLAPVIMINDDTHGKLAPDKIKEILSAYN